jgi:hypothetical protein
VSYSLDGGVTWNTITNETTNRSIVWNLPVVRQNRTKMGLVRVIGYDGNKRRMGSDQSDGPFSIEGFSITRPNGGETFRAGQSENITWIWHGEDPAKVMLYYSFNNGQSWNVIDNVAGNGGGLYRWTVPALSRNRARTQCKVRVVLRDSKGQILGIDESDGTFTIGP